MEIRNNIGYRPKSAAPTFGAICYESAEKTLRKVLTLKELSEFKELVAQNKIYDKADLILFGEGKKLYGKICDHVQLNNGKTVHVSPWFFENKFEWIKKMVQKMRTRHEEVTELLAKQNFEF